MDVTEKQIVVDPQVLEKPVDVVELHRLTEFLRQLAVQPVAHPQQVRPEGLAALAVQDGV